jgi:hypothetical protein
MSLSIPNHFNAPFNSYGSFNPLELRFDLIEEYVIGLSGCMT